MSDRLRAGRNERIGSDRKDSARGVLGETEALNVFSTCSESDKTRLALIFCSLTKSVSMLSMRSSILLKSKFLSASSIELSPSVRETIS